MDIQTDGGGLSVPEGTMAIFVDPDGRILGVLIVAGGVYQDLLKQSLGSIDPTREEHTEVELKVASVPLSSNRPRLQGVETMKICRNKSGNPVTCPPR